MADEISGCTNVLVAGYKPELTHDIVKTCEKVNQVEDHQLLQIHQKYESVL
jgi:hypothetical protein